MPMKALYLRAFLSQMPTNIFLFTGKNFPQTSLLLFLISLIDGHANQPEYLLDLIRRNATRARLFPFGIGPNPSRYLYSFYLCSLLVISDVLLFHCHLFFFTCQLKSTLGTSFEPWHERDLAIQSLLHQTKYQILARYYIIYLYIFYKYIYIYFC